MNKYCLNCKYWDSNGVCTLLTEEALEFNTCNSHREEEEYKWVIFSLTNEGKLNIFDFYETEKLAFEYRNKIAYLKDHQVAHVEELLPNE